MTELRLMALCLILSALTQAAEIVQVIPSRRAAEVSHDSEHFWKQNEYACTFPVAQPQAVPQPSCGKIVTVTENGAILQFFSSDVSMAIAEGQRVIPVEPNVKPGAALETPRNDLEAELVPLYSALVFGSKKAREENWSGKSESQSQDRKVATATPQPAAESSTTSSIKSRPHTETINLTAGANLINPLVSVEMRVVDQWSIGLSPRYHKVSKLGVNSSLLGAALTANFYPSQMWEGFWVQAGIGMFSGKTNYKTKNDTQSATALFGGVGWRLAWSSFNAGISVGAQYLTLKKTSKLEFDLVLVDPMVVLSVGWLL